MFIHNESERVCKRLGTLLFLPLDLPIANKASPRVRQKGRVVGGWESSGLLPHATTGLRRRHPTGYARASLGRSRND